MRTLCIISQRSYAFWKVHNLFTFSIQYFNKLAEKGIIPFMCLKKYLFDVISIMPGHRQDGQYG